MTRIFRTATSVSIGSWIGCWIMGGHIMFPIVFMTGAFAVAIAEYLIADINGEPKK